MKTRSIFPIILFVLGFLIQSVSAQTTTAKIKFEEAEKAFEDRDYRNAVLLVNEVEKIIKTTSPKTLYLKILANQKLGFSDFKSLQKFRSDIVFFLEKYDNLEDIQDRYREVYEVSKTLHQYPATEEAFIRFAQEKAQAVELQRKRELAMEKIKKGIEAIDVELEMPLKIGVLKSEVPSTVWPLVSKGVPFSKWEHGIIGSGTIYTRKADRKFKVTEGINDIYFDDNDRMLGMSLFLIQGYDNSSIVKVKEEYQGVFKAMINAFGEENLIIKNEVKVNTNSKWTTASVQLKDYAPSQVEFSMTIVEWKESRGVNAELLYYRRKMGSRERDSNQ